ncbi:hypothetical protein GF377_08310, partial [candidate division GN15 bacterium]|nr:hypothetical protein [candidate division GN15 bacterium]
MFEIHRYTRAATPRARLLALITAIALTALLAVGCSDDDDPISSQEDHFEAVGFLIYASGVPVLDYFGPDYGPGDNIANMDTLFLSQGLNPGWDSKFYNEDTVEINPPAGTAQTLSASFADPIAELWWHAGEEGQFEDFHLRG